MGQIVNYFCYKCVKGTTKSGIESVEVPVVKDLLAKGGKGNVVLAHMGTFLEMEEQELCPNCMKEFNKIKNKYLGLIAQEWSQFKTETQ